MKTETYTNIKEQRERNITEWQQALDFVKGIDDDTSIQEIKGQLYRAETPDDHELLDWDKPLHKQPEGVKSAIRSLVAKAYGKSNVDYFLTGRDGVSATGKEFYKKISQNPKKASEMLLTAGIPGLRYLDGNSRGAGDGSHNYVIWDESRLNRNIQTYYQRSATTKAAYEKRIDELFSGARPNINGVRVLDTSDALDMLGFGGMPVVVNEKHAIVEGADNHPLTATQWKTIPDWIDNPALVIERAKDGHINLIAPEKVDGKIVVIALEPRANPAGGHAPGNQRHLLLTAYAKDTGTLPLRRMIETGDAKPLYVDQAKGPKFYDGSGGQFPGSVNELRASNRSIKTNRDLYKYRIEHQQFGDVSLRGSITLADDQAIIHLFREANSSTLPHEFSHLWLEEMRRDALRPDAPESLRRDMATIHEWLGVPDGEELERHHHEQFAQGFETYLKEGRAPSIALAQVFEAFKQWLSRLFHTANEAGVPINDAMRTVFDRMLASDAEIQATVTVLTRVSKKTRLAFNTWCERRHTTPAAQLRRLIDSVIDAPRVADRLAKVAMPRPASDPDRSALRVELRLRTGEKNLAMQLAERDGITLQQWFIARLLDARLKSEDRFMGTPELRRLADEIENIMRSLLGMATNLNQVARALNSTRASGQKIAPERLLVLSVIEKDLMAFVHRAHGVLEQLDNSPPPLPKKNEPPITREMCERLRSRLAARIHENTAASP
ncbi:MAG: plasmid mobilization relaxosome protein MobC [Azoarcus sp.]|nr:plasmid mobilization relaxosome protein MobC [Azoarcus sp.]